MGTRGHHRSSLIVLVASLPLAVERGRRQERIITVRAVSVPRHASSQVSTHEPPSTTNGHAYIETDEKNPRRSHFGIWNSTISNSYESLGDVDDFAFCPSYSCFQSSNAMARTFAAASLHIHRLGTDLSPPVEPKIEQDGSCREPFAHVPEDLAGRRARRLDQRLSQNVGRQGAIFAAG